MAKKNKNIKQFFEFDNADFTAFIGNIQQENFNKGTLLIKMAIIILFNMEHLIKMEKKKEIYASFIRQKKNY